MISKKAKVNRLKLSSWNLPGEVLEYYHRCGVKEMFPWQVQCLQTGKALDGGNLLYSAPTSAGKSLVAEILALKRVLATKKKAIFILPFISVAREKMFALRGMYSGLGLTVGGFMGSQSPPGGFKRVDIAVCTIERANSLINRLLESGKLHKLAVIIIDELHMVGDSSRGCLIEPLLTKVNYYIDSQATSSDSSSEISVQIIGMSATLPNMHILSKWLKADLYCTDFRPVPLTEYVKIGSSILDINMEYVRNIDVPGVYNNDTELIVNLCLETIKEEKSVLIFCPGKMWCEKLSTLIAKSFYMIMAGKEETSALLSGPVTKAIDKEKILEVIDELKRTPAGLSEQLKLCISYASAYHHAGLTMEEKDVVESAFRKSIIRVLVSTTTLSSGVNLPAQRVIIRSPMFLGQLIDTLTYKQMVGRAGRKGIDSLGESILICKPSERKLVQELLTSELRPATSQLIRRDEDGNFVLRSSVKRALLEMIASGTAKTVCSLNKYLSCTLLAAEVESHSGNVSHLVDSCIQSLHSDEFINITKSDGEDTGIVTPTQLGSAVFASSMNPEESLIILCDLNKARKQFVLENELHMVYQVTPINALSDTIDWMRFLSLWEALPVDQKRVGELVGVSERFITLSHQGRRRRNNENQQKSLRIHRRFYMALVLHDLVNEVPLQVVEKKFGVNKGALQSLQQNAAIFAGMICTFCDKLGWTPLKLLLSDFQQRLDLGVRRELVDLIRITCLDAKKARHFYDSGIHSVSEVVNSTIEHISHLLQTFLPFESSKQSYGETEWELKGRTARRVFISNRKSLTISEAAQFIMSEAEQVFQQDLDQLGLHNSMVSVKHSHSTQPIAANRADSPPQVSQHSPKLDTSTAEGIHTPPTTLDTLFTGAKATTSHSITHTKSLFFARKAKESSYPASEELISDSQQSEDYNSKYKELLDRIETHTSLSVSTDQTVKPVVDSNQAPVQRNTDNDSSLVWEDSLLLSSQGSVKDEGRPSSQSGSQSTKLSDGEIRDHPLESCVFTPDTHTMKRVRLSPDLTYTRLKKVRRIRTSTTKSLSQSSHSNKLETSSSQPLPSTPFIPLGQRSNSSTLQQAHVKNVDSNTPSCVLKCSDPLVDSNIVATPVIRPAKSGAAATPVPNQVPVVDASLLITPINNSRVDVNATVWSPNDNSLLVPSEKKQSISTKTDEESRTRESNDLFSKSMDSLVWSPLPEVQKTLPASTTAEKGDGSTNRPITPPSTQPPLVQDSPRISSADRIIIVDVMAHPSLYDTFLSDWSEATVYSLSLACAPIIQQETVVPGHTSIGYHSATTGSQHSDIDSQLSTSTIVSPEGVVLHQYSVMVCGLSVCLNSNTVFYIDLTEQQDSQCDVITTLTKQKADKYSIKSRITDMYRILSKKSTSKVIFDSKEHGKRLASLVGHNLELEGVIDPKVALWLQDPAEKEYNLIGAVNKTVPYLSSVITSNIGVCIGNGSVALNPHSGTSPRLRSCYESLAAMAMRRPLLSSLKEHGLLDAFTTLEMPHLACLSKMEVDGFGFDVAEFNRQTKNILDSLNAIEKKCNSFSKKALDLGSHKDVGEVLFVELRLPYEKKKVVSRRGAPWSTAQAQLEKIKSLHPLPGLILLWRKLHSALKTLVQPLDRSKVWCEERSMYRIYSTCSLQTATGRITMYEPNLQTIRKDIPLDIDGLPNMADKSISLRNVFTAPTGYTLLSADYSQLELRIISHLASDPTLIPLLNAGGDVFKDIASRWKSVPLAEVTDEQRQQAKQICYGIIYGMGSKALSEHLLVDEDTAEQLVSEFQSTFIGLKKYIVSVVESCKNLGYVKTIAGRKRYLPAINSKNNRMGRSQAERQAVNTTVQGSAADLVKLSTIKLHKTLNKDVSLVLQIHDELIYEVPTPLLQQTALLVKETMESVAKDLHLQVVMTVRVKSGPTWAQLKELELS